MNSLKTKKQPCAHAHNPIMCINVDVSDIDISRAETEKCRVHQFHGP